jgi:hypothetical protein
MSGPYFIETLARNGDVLHRHQLANLPIRLGRGYDNDFIVDDAHAAPRHAIIEADADVDGQIVLRDLGSRNGVIHRGRRQDRIVLGGDTVVRLGHTSLRLRSADYPVEAELVDRTMHGWEGALPGLVGMMFIGLFSGFTVWLNDTNAFEWIRYLQALAYGAGAALVWAGVWAFANRLFGRHARLGRHLFIVGCGLMAITAFKVVSSLLAYAFSFEALTRYGAHLAILIAAGMVYFHLSTVKPQHRRRFAISVLLLAALGSGLTLIGNEQRSGQLSDELYMTLLLPPATRLAPDHGVDEFMGRIGAMKARLDTDRTKKVKDETSDEEE